MNYFHLTWFLALILSFFTPKPATVAVTIPPPHTVIEDDNYISWSSSRKLEWTDFLCEPKKNTDAVASTSTTLGLAYQVKNGNLFYQITCNFSKHKSWGLLKTDYILAHEQGHFDITEVFARKLHYQLNAYTYNRKTFKADIGAIYEKIVSEKEEMQKAYDAESDHSRNRKMQQAWLIKINDMLVETAGFEAYP